MKKKTDNRKSKFKNPLSGIPTKSLLITLFALLITFAVGFGSGYGCSAHAISQGSATITAYAQEKRYQNYTFKFPQAYVYSSGVSPVLSMDFVYPRYPLGNSPNYFVQSNSVSGYNSKFIQSGGISLPSVGLQTIFTPYRRIIGVWCSPVYEYGEPNSTQGIRFHFNLGYIQSMTDSSITIGAYLNSHFKLVDSWRDFNSTILSNTNIWYYEFIESGAEPVSSSTPVYISVLNSSAITVLDWNSYSVRLGQPSLVAPLYCSYNVSMPGVNSVYSPTYRGFSCAYRFYYGDLNARRYIDLCFEFLAPNLTSSSAPGNALKDVFHENFDILNLNGADSSFNQSSYDLGFNAGFGSGKQQGIAIGYQRGINEKIEDITPWSHIVNGVNSFLNLQILPGVRISVILTITFGLILVGFLLKFYLGG